LDQKRGGTRENIKRVQKEGETGKKEGGKKGEGGYGEEWQVRGRGPENRNSNSRKSKEKSRF